MKRAAPRLALIKDGGRKIAVYEGRKHLATYEVDGTVLDAAIVEEARTWGTAPPAASQAPESA